MVAAVVLGLVLRAGESLAWIYSEHRDIAVLALVGLDAERRSTIDGMWAEARMGHEDRMCATAAEPVQGEKPSCFDWAAWSAVAGDHTCSGQDLVTTILDSKWIVEVAAITAHLKQQLAKAKSRSERVNDLLRSDLKLQRADPEYATRASSNSVHFLLARPEVEIARHDYFRLCLEQGAEPNAVGAYAWYHLSALMKASRFFRLPAAAAERSALARAALADEAFALHFLEDAFSAGHVAGTWGNAAMRKGTHDFYNERGLDAHTFNHAEHVLQGDGNITPEGARRAAETARISIEQIADAARGRVAIPSDDGGATSSPGALDVCTLSAMPARPLPPAVVPMGAAVVSGLPVPALTDGPGDLPRFRAELGPFIGLSAAAFSSYLNHAFGADQTRGGAAGGIEIGVRLGLGLAGVLSEAGDGLVFLDVGLRQDTASTMTFTQEGDLAQAEAIPAAIPPRSALTVRVRAPFWLVPGDLVLGALFVAPFSRHRYTEMAIQASNGGLVPWQAGLATPVGRFQFVLGREVAISFYGYIRGRDRMLMPPVEPGTSPRLVALRSISFEFPVVEYRPFRSFTMDQASVVKFQLMGGFQSAGGATLIAPAGAPLPDLHTIYSLGIRAAFDWRHY